jgi:hypothetical protein
VESLERIGSRIEDMDWAWFAGQAGHGGQLGEQHASELERDTQCLGSSVEENVVRHRALRHGDRNWQPHKRIDFHITEA